MVSDGDDDPDKDPFPAQHFDLEVPVGSTSLDVTVKVLADGEEEDQEHMTFMVFRGEELVNAGTWGGTGVNIERSDAGVVKQLAVADAEATEGEDPSLDFVVTLAPAAEWTVTVDYATRDGTARVGADYTDTSGTLTFASGETEKTVSVPVIDDTVEDTPETLTLGLSNADPPYNRNSRAWGSREAGVLIADSVATGTIRNTEDQAEPRAVSVSDASAAEGDAVAFAVSLSATSSQQVTVEYATSGGTATSGTDFTAQSGTLTFAANETSKTVSVPTTDDSVDEEHETFTLTLSSPTNATLGDATATGTIRNTETATPLTASFEDVPATHDGSTVFTFKVRFSEAPAVSFRVLRDSAAFTVSAGTVKKALRVDGRDDLREIHIEPSGTGDITVTLVGGRACGTTGAICTSDGRPLSNSPSATITGPGTSSGSDGDGDDALLALVANVTPEAAAAALFGENALTDDQRAAMDQLGNRNGAYDLGDLLSWMARCRRNEASCGRTVSGTDAGSSAGVSGNAANETTGPNPAAEEGERPRRAALRPEHGRERGTRRADANAAALKLVAVKAFAELWLMPRLPAFLRTHPEIVIEFETDHHEVDPARRAFDSLDRIRRRGPAHRAERGAVRGDARPGVQPGLACIEGVARTPGRSA